MQTHEPPDIALGADRDGADRDGAGAAGGGPARPRRLPPAGPLAGLALLGLYLTLLARNDLAARLPGGWKGPAVLCGALLLVAVALGLRQRGWTAARAGAWARAHGAALAIGGSRCWPWACACWAWGLACPIWTIRTSPPWPTGRCASCRAAISTRTTSCIRICTPTCRRWSFCRASSCWSRRQDRELDPITPTDFYLWGRLLTALLGTLTVPLMYLAGRRLYGMAAGVIAATLMGGQQCPCAELAADHHRRPGGVFQRAGAGGHRLAAAGGSAWIAHRPAGAHGPLPGGGGGRGAGDWHQVQQRAGAAAVFAGPRLRGLGHRGRPPAAALPGGRLWAGLGALAVAFFLTTPFALFDLPHFLNDLASVVAHYRRARGLRERLQLALLCGGVPPQRHSAHAAHSGGRGAGLRPPPARRRRAGQLSGGVLLHDEQLPGQLPAQPVADAAIYVDPRGGGAGGGLARAGRLAARHGARPAAPVGGARAPGGGDGGGHRPATVAPARHDYLHAQPDNRVRAVGWLDANAPPGARCGWRSRRRNDAGPLSGRPALMWRIPARMVRSQPGRLPGGQRAAYKDVSDHPEHDPPLHDAYVRFFAANAARLVADFPADKETHPGPALRIYRTGYAPPAAPRRSTPRGPSARYSQTVLLC